VSPANLGQLPSDLPAPTGLCQIKRGVGGVITWNNTVPAQGMQDGGGSLMALYLTPPRRGWWLVHAVTMWLQIEAVWSSFEIGVDLNVADLNGRIRHKLQHSQHAAQGWQTIHVDAPFYLEGGQAYSCVTVWLYSSGCNQQYHCDPAYHWIEGEFIGDGAY